MFMFGLAQDSLSTINLVALTDVSDRVFCAQSLMLRLRKGLMATIDPIVLKFRAALDEVYGKRIERIVLYGSRARGDARPDSDYDIAVFLNGLSDRWSEFDRIAKIETDILYETGAVIHTMPFHAGAYRDRTPLMHEIRREGVDL
jgi:uncharacterized protein